MNVLLVLIILVLSEAATSDRQSEEEELRRIKRQDEELANCDKCGLSFDQTQRVPVIINGTNVASSQKYPWMVALIQTGTDHIFCGGAIIAQNFILTAAHCMVDVENQPMKADNNKKSVNGTKKGGTKKNLKGLLMSIKEVTIGFLTPGWYTGVKPATGAANIMIHPEYYYDSGKAHDIALIELSRPINCNTHANPICLPPADVLLPKESLVRISGYGQQDPANPVPAQELSEAVIEVIDKSECMNMGFQKEDLELMYCLRGYKGETPCFGDSGGSMFSKMYGEKYVTLGVASLQSSPTCSPDASVVYTSVSHHLPWIHEMMRGGGDYQDEHNVGANYGGDYESGDYGDYYDNGDYYDGGMKGKDEKKKGNKRKSTTKSSSTKKGKDKGKSTTESSSTKKGKKGKESKTTKKEKSTTTSKPTTKKEKRTTTSKPTTKKGQGSTEMSIYKKIGLKPRHKAV